MRLGPLRRVSSRPLALVPVAMVVAMAVVVVVVAVVVVFDGIDEASRRSRRAGWLLVVLAGFSSCWLASRRAGWLLVVLAGFSSCWHRPQTGVRESRAADCLVGSRAAVDGHQVGRDQAEDDPSGRGGDLERQAVTGGDDRLEEQGDDSGRDEKRAEDAERADLAVLTEVGLEHRGENHGIDDQG